MEEGNPPGQTPPVERVCSISLKNRRYGSLTEESTENLSLSIDTSTVSPRSSYIAVAVLCYINLLNYMDRYTIAGIQTTSVSTYVNYLYLALLIRSEMSC